MTTLPDLPSHEARRRTKHKPPRTYEVICISTYAADLALLDGKVMELKRRGYSRANRSQLIRWAIRQLDLDQLPPHDSGP